MRLLQVPFLNGISFFVYYPQNFLPSLCCDVYVYIYIHAVYILNKINDMARVGFRVLRKRLNELGW